MLEFNATFIISIISFVIFIWIMNIIYYKPILNIIKKRDSYISDNHGAAVKFTEQTEYYKNDIIEQTENEKRNCREKIAHAVEKAKRNAADKINTNILSAGNKIQAQKDILKEEKSKIANDINSNRLEDISNVLVDKLMRGN